MRRKRERMMLAWALAFGLGLLSLTGAGWLAWRLMLLVSPDAARLWALIATGLLPAVGYAAWCLGQLEARGRLAGMDQAIGKVMGAAARTADLRAGATQAIQRAATRPPEIVALPEVEITRRAPAPASDVVEL